MRVGMSRFRGTRGHLGSSGQRLLSRKGAGYRDSRHQLQISREEKRFFLMPPIGHDAFTGLRIYMARAAFPLMILALASLGTRNDNQPRFRSHKSPSELSSH